MKIKLFFVFTLIFAFSCKNNESDSDLDETAQIPFEIYERVYGVTSEIFQDDNWVYINVNSLPDHGSPYYEGTQWEESLYVPYDGSNPFVSNFILNPNRISVQNIFYTSTSTSLKWLTIGISIAILIYGIIKKQKSNN